MGGVSNQRIWLPGTTAGHNEEESISGNSPDIVISGNQGRNKMIFFKNKNKNKNKNRIKECDREQEKSKYKSKNKDQYKNKKLQRWAIGELI